ncbi:MAG: radical SAM protein [Methanoregula sp.]
MPVQEYPLTADLTAPPRGVPSAPDTIELQLTGRCNLSCRYCFYADSMKGRYTDLPTEQWLAFLKEIGDLGVRRVTLAGGEPFVRSDLFTIIDGVVDNRMRYRLLTNGTLVTEEVISAFSKGKRRLRMDSVQVSIDGSCAEVHDKSRPPASFDRAIRGLRLLKAAGFPVTVRMTLNHHNIDDLENTARLLLDDIGLSGFSTNGTEAMGTAKCEGENIVLSKEDQLQAMKILTALNEKYNGRISANAGPLTKAHAVKDIEERIARGETGIPGRGKLNCCGGVFSKMAVLHDGTMVPCNMLPKLVMGVMGMHPLKEAWLHSPAINAVRLRRELPITVVPSCTDCRYAWFCAGGCPASVMARTGNLIGRDPNTCYRIFMNEEACQ